jgi:hypothetical protein
VFVLSPDALTSDIALKEVAYATSLNKRFAPVVCRTVDDRAVPETLRRLNFRLERRFQPIREGHVFSRIRDGRSWPSGRHLRAMAWNPHASVPVPPDRNASKLLEGSECGLQCVSMSASGQRRPPSELIFPWLGLQVLGNVSDDVLDRRDIIQFVITRGVDPFRRTNSFRGEHRSAGRGAADRHRMDQEAHRARRSRAPVGRWRGIRTGLCSARRPWRRPSAGSLRARGARRPRLRKSRLSSPRAVARQPGAATLSPRALRRGLSWRLRGLVKAVFIAEIENSRHLFDHLVGAAE